MVQHSDRGHALLSASGAHRWMNCAPSARLEEQFPNKDTIYSLEGTVAHEVAEQTLQLWHKKDFEGDIPEPLDCDMVIHKGILPYVEYIADAWRTAQSKSNDTVLFLEQKLDLDFMIPDGFGTGDAVIIYGNTLEIIDLKYGKGIKVEAQDNEQLRCYAAGAYKLFEDLYEDIENISMTIVQPRLDHVSNQTISKDTLMAWVENEVVPKAKIAYEGTGEFIPGDHCHFCKAGAVCRARAEQNLELAKKEFVSPDVLDINEVAKILNVANQLTKWVETLNAYALGQAKLGEQIPGYKLVEGRSVRTYVDEEKIIDELKKQEYQEALLYEPKKVLGVTKMEKLLGKKLFKTYLEDTGLVCKPKGKPTLVQDSDARKPISFDALEDFKGE